VKFTSVWERQQAAGALPRRPCEELDLRLVDFNGGTLRNAIPREAFATVAVAADKVDALKTLVAAYQDILKNELAAKEKNLVLLLDLSPTTKRR
jgi:dipeptidase D